VGGFQGNSFLKGRLCKDCNVGPITGAAS
jgi:hypothetical protein